MLRERPCASPGGKGGVTCDLFHLLIFDWQELDVLIEKTMQVLSCGCSLWTVFFFWAGIGSFAGSLRLPERRIGGGRGSPAAEPSGRVSEQPCFSHSLHHSRTSQCRTSHHCLANEGQGSTFWLYEKNFKGGHFLTGGGSHYSCRVTFDLVEL